jgi:hypothetical protein
VIHILKIVKPKRKTNFEKLLNAVIYRPRPGMQILFTIHVIILLSLSCGISVSIGKFCPYFKHFGYTISAIITLDLSVLYDDHYTGPQQALLHYAIFFIAAFRYGAFLTTSAMFIYAFKKSAVIEGIDDLPSHKVKTIKTLEEMKQNLIYLQKEKQAE